MVLGASAMVFPLVIHTQIIYREMNILLLASVVFAAMLYGGVLGRLEGIILFVGILVYVFYSIYDAKRSPKAAGEIDLDDVLSPEEIAAAKKGGLKDSAKDLGLIAIGVVAVCFRHITPGVSDRNHGVVAQGGRHRCWQRCRFLYLQSVGGGWRNSKRIPY